MTSENKPLLSVIIPSFNSEKTIRACIDSVVGQSYGNIEIIVVDGLSSDTTTNILREYESLHPNLKWTSEKDEGIYDAINKGIRRSKGDWIYILGSDDRLYESKTLETVVSFLGERNEGVVYGNVKVKGDAGWAVDGQIHDGEFDLEKLLNRNICQQAVFYHRSLFEKIGYFNTEYPICADWDFMLHCAAKSSMKFMNVIVAEFNGGGASKTNKEEKFYNDFAQNMFAYFRFRIFRKDFKTFSWRFKKYSETQKASGKRISAFFFNLVYNRLNS
ncbi:MAG TPA: glycosyltransferase family 2 protein [Bacteroidia bacterium]|nr:glycosyltransferase family 2 protein [Bacteroidia bacterium]